MKINELTVAEDDRILLRIAGEEDAQDLKDLFDAPLSEEQAKMMIAHFTEAWKDGTEANLVIVDKADSRITGVVSLYDIRKDNSLQIGYRIREKERGKHYATDAAELISPLLIRKYGAQFIRATAHTDNYASICVLTNSGYKLVGQSGSVCMFLYDEESLKRAEKIS